MRECWNTEIPRRASLHALDSVRSTVTRAAELGKPELDLHTESYWSLTEQGALLCRQGKHSEALIVLERSLKANSRRDSYRITWIWLARAHAGLGENETARMWLSKTATYLDKSSAKPEAMHVHDWLEAQLLRCEVQAILDRLRWSSLSTGGAQKN